MLALRSLGPIRQVLLLSKRLCAPVATRLHCTVLRPGISILQLRCPSTYVAATSVAAADAEKKEEDKKEEKKEEEEEKHEVRGRA